MNLKMLTIGAVAHAMMTDAALAGSSTGTSALDDPAKMSPSGQPALSRCGSVYGR